MYKEEKAILSMPLGLRRTSFFEKISGDWGVLNKIIKYCD